MAGHNHLSIEECSDQHQRSRIREQSLAGFRAARFVGRNCPWGCGRFSVQFTGAVEKMRILDGPKTLYDGTPLTRYTLRPQAPLVAEFDVSGDVTIEVEDSC